MDTLARLTLEHRRVLAALCAGLAVLAALGSHSESAGTPVVVAAHAQRSGAVLTEGDVRTQDFPPDAVPDGSFSSVDAVIGRRVAGPMNEGESFTTSRILDPSAFDGYGSEAVLASVRIAEAESVDSIRVGDVVDVVAVDPHGEHAAEVAARAVTVVTVPDEVDDDQAVTIRIATDEPTALTLASAAITSRFTVLLTHR